MLGILFQTEDHRAEVWTFSLVYKLAALKQVLFV